MINESQTKAPKKRIDYYQRWLIFAPLSLILVGFGLCVFGEAVLMKWRQDPFIKWFLAGTYSLILINGGLCLLGEAIKSRVFYELMVRRKSILKKRQLKALKNKPK